MAIKSFNSIAGFSVNDNSGNAYIIIDGSGNVNTPDLTVTGNSDLGNLGNVTITGGSAGYVITTDGAGNLTWQETGSPSIIQNGNSNVTIPVADGNVIINSNGGTDYQWSFGAYGPVSGLTLPSGGTVITSPAGDIDIFTGNAGLGYSEIWLQEGNSVLINTAAGVNSWEFTTDGNLIAPNDINAYSFTSNAGVVDFTTASNVALGTVSNIHITGGVAGQAIITDGAGNLSFANASAAPSPAPMPTYVAVGDTLLVPNNYQGLFGYPITVDGTMTVDGVLVDVNDGGGGGTPGGANTTLQFNNEGVFGGISTATYSGGKLSLGSNAQVKISGGTTGQVLSTDGAGNLSWTTGGGGSGGFLSVYPRSGSTIQITITGGYLNVVGRSGIIPVAIS